MFSSKRVYYSVKYEAGNRNLGKMPKRVGGISRCLSEWLHCRTVFCMWSNIDSVTHRQAVTSPCCIVELLLLGFAPLRSHSDIWWWISLVNFTGGGVRKSTILTQFTPPRLLPLCCSNVELWQLMHVWFVHITLWIWWEKFADFIEDVIFVRMQQNNRKWESETNNAESTIGMAVER